MKWVFERCDGGGDAVETPIGRVPALDALDIEGLNIAPAALRTLLTVDTERWKEEVPSIREHYAPFGDRLPQGLRDELAALEKRLTAAH